jgi:hypothetical protein
VRVDGGRVVSKQHTPGTWRAVDYRDDRWRLVAEDPTTGKRVEIAEIHRKGIEPSQRVANAVLLESAPLLLAACEAMVALLDASEPEPGASRLVAVNDRGRASEVVAAMRAAIAKARAS